MTGLFDQQYVVHLYAPADGPDAPAAYRGLCEIWRGCRLAFQMTEPVDGLGLPQLPPPSPDEVPVAEGAFALQERPFADSQAVLRRHHDVLNLSVALAPPETRAAQDGQWTWWREFDRTWNAISAEHAPHMLGEARLFLAGVEDGATPPEALLALLPGAEPAEAGPAGRAAHPQGAALDPGLRLWEPDPGSSSRALRRLVLAAAPGADARASHWVWSSGGTGIPPLARYLLHAAKVRYEMRVWQRDGQGRELSRALDTLSADLLKAGSDPASADLLRARSGQALLLLADLRLLRRAADIAADNMRRALSGAQQLLAVHPFADDAADAQEFLERLEDQIAFLEARTTRSTTLLPLAPTVIAPEPEAKPATKPRAEPEPEREPEADRAARLPGSAAERGGWPTDQDTDTVFVIHGRDEPARAATFELLRAFGLHPVEWDEAVGLLDQPMPFLGRVLREAIPRAKAVVVIMTPDDIVRLHPGLARPGEPSFETGPSMQARPNVLIELGMALAYHPHSTLILQVGDHRPIADLGGFNYVRIAEGSGFRERIGRRLIYAKCRVRMPPDGPWRTAGDFGPAERRRPDPS